MTNRESTKAWHQLGTIVLRRDCSFKRTHGACHESDYSGHGYRLQERAHLTDVGEVIVGMACARRLA